MWKKIFYLLTITLLFFGCSPEPDSNGDINRDGVKISGRVTYDRVPSTLIQGGVAKLDYNNIRKEASKNILIKAIDSNGQAIAVTSTDNNGRYKLFVPSNSDIKIRAYAKMYKENYWDVSVVDNTNNRAMYVIDGKYHNSGAKGNIINLHAQSGWRGDDYGPFRVAGPFAILATIDQAMEKVRRADKSAKFPKLTVNWSVNNIAAAGDMESGQIITSNYDGERGLWILGDANSDTDEYDDHIIAHEWGHYFEDQFSRADNIGGSHSPAELLDIRVAFGEGWGNAFSGIATDNPIYFDTSGYKQSTGWYMDLENGVKENAGWYSEGSVQRILYDLYDKHDEAHDRTSLGFKPIYDVLVGAERNTPAFTSIFSFIHALKRENSGDRRDIDRTVANENISSITDEYGSNRANGMSTTPLYKSLRVGGSVEACTQNVNGVYNKLGNRKYIKVKIDSSGVYQFNAHSNNYSADPDMVLYQTKYPHDNIGISSYEGSPDDTLMVTLKRGNYLLDVYDSSFNNSCSIISVNRTNNSMKPNKKAKKVVSKSKRVRRLPKRQYY
jgi:hypothetical protein